MSTERSTFEELSEIIEDVLPDYARSFAHVDAKVDALLKELLYRIFRSADSSAPDGGIEESLGNIEALLYWFFLIGREHALRGYVAPAPKSGISPGIPDNIQDLLEGPS